MTDAIRNSTVQTTSANITINNYLMTINKEGLLWNKGKKLEKCLQDNKVNGLNKVFVLANIPIEKADAQDSVLQCLCSDVLHSPIVPYNTK